MSCLGIEKKQMEKTVLQNTSSRCATPITIKVGVLVLGLLLIGAGSAMNFLHVNVTASFVTGGLGGATILGLVIWSVVDCQRGKAKDLGVRELKVELSKVEDNSKIAEDKVAELLRNNPNLEKLTVVLQLHRMDTNWEPDFKALDAHFKRNVGESSGSQYVYDRK